MLDLGHQFVANLTDMGKIFGLEHEIVGTEPDCFHRCFGIL